MARLGIFGGTFDPPHVGHLIAAEYVRDLYELEMMLFVPAAQPPHKTVDEVSGSNHRLEMLRLATSGNERFAVSDLELHRAGASYTLDTLRALKIAQPDRDLVFFIGMDQLLAFHEWHEPEQIMQLARVIGMRRPTYARDVAKGSLQEAIEIVAIPMIDISSTMIRQRVSEGRSIRYLVPLPVQQYIMDHALYR